MPLKASDVESALLRKGFAKKNKKDRRFIYYKLDGTKGIQSTMISHGATEISDNLIGKMAIQLDLSTANFKKLVECTMDQKEYEKKVYRSK